MGRRPPLEIFMQPEVPYDQLPCYQSAGAAGFDISAWIPTGHITIPSGECQMIATGVHMMIPDGFEVQIRSRSGLAAKHGICVLNAPGTIDCDYRGEVRVILANHGPKKHTIISGDRIAQGVISAAPQCKIVRAHSMRFDTERGEKGFGSTG